MEETGFGKQLPVRFASLPVRSHLQEAENAIGAKKKLLKKRMAMSNPFILLFRKGSKQIINTNFFQDIKFSVVKKYERRFALP